MPGNEVSGREVVLLGTASQVPTRARAHHATVLRWDGTAILFDPGEGTQRQLTLAGVAPPSIRWICITHFHGDHCLGLPGVLQRLSLDRTAHPVEVHFPASGQEYFTRLRHAAIFADTAQIHPRPVTDDGVVQPGPPLRLIARRLDHTADAFGWRVEEPDGLRMLPDRLAAAGIAGPEVGRLQREGVIRAGGRLVALDEVSAPRSGQKVAFVMDTRWCDGALALADGVDLLVCEATFLEPERDLAERFGHLTAAQAAHLARQAGARRLVLTHLSQRHPDEAHYHAEAAPIFPDVIVARDLARVAVPRRR